MQKSLLSLHVSCKEKHWKTVGCDFPFACQAQAGVRESITSRVPEHSHLSLWLLFNPLQPSEEFSVALAMPCPSSLFFQISSIKLNRRVEWKEIVLSLLTVL